MTADSIAAWQAFLDSPAAPKTALSPLALDGYLTGVIVTPEPTAILPSAWLPGLWGDDEPIFDDLEQAKGALGAAMAHYNALIATIDESLRRLEVDGASDHRPLFLPADGKPSHAAVRQWVKGFWKAMALAPAAWSALAEDERTQVLVQPFVGFFAPEIQGAFERPDDIDDLLDGNAALIPRAITVLRKLAVMRQQERPPTAPQRRTKIGRNDPCPCGSGQKYKRCCGRG